MTHSLPPLFKICLGLAAISSVASGQSAVNRISLHIGSVTLGDSPGLVKKTLGKPKSERQNEIENCGRWKVLRFQYPGVTIQFSKDPETKTFTGVDRIEVRRAKFAVAPGVRIGSSYKVVRHLLGDPQSEIVLRGNVTEAYYVTATNDRAQLTFFKHKLWQVVWFVDPC